VHSHVSDVAGYGHPHRVSVPSVPAGVVRPLWSVMIPTYNCARYLGATLESVLAQDPGPEVMQIEVVDDHSTRDEPAVVVERVGGGRVSFFQQPSNRGHTENFATCLRRSRGTLIHLLHGDDGVRPGFYSRMHNAFVRAPEIGAAFCRQIFMDQDGHWREISPLEQDCSGILQDALQRMASEQRVMTPSIVVRREVYERLGGFDDRLRTSEDWEMWVRVAAHYPIWYEVEPLATYRIHTDSNTGRHVARGDDIRSALTAIEVMADELRPAGVTPAITRKAKGTYAVSAMQAASRFLVAGDVPAARAQLSAALECSRSPKFLGRMMLEMGRAAIRRIRAR
jgi:hypothetical protein